LTKDTARASIPPVPKHRRDTLKKGGNMPEKILLVVGAASLSLLFYIIVTNNFRADYLSARQQKKSTLPSERRWYRYAQIIGIGIPLLIFVLFALAS
jgi:hypothetical protein